MCGIAGIFDLQGQSLPNLESHLLVMNDLIEHRGPDGQGVWMNTNHSVGLAHRRLSIIDLSENGAQPMVAPNATAVTYNGEIYNYKELQAELSSTWNFKTGSDTETILAAYNKYGQKCLDHLKGMFAFALWDEKRSELFCALDRFGIKPFYYAVIDGRFLFSSEMKALLPFLDEITTDEDVLSEYFTFQYTLGEKTLFKGIYQLLPGQKLTLKDGQLHKEIYWDLEYNHDDSLDLQKAQQRMRELVGQSLDQHLRSDVPVASYVSGGVDSSLMALLAAQKTQNMDGAFHGRFMEYPGYDESSYAKTVAEQINQPFRCIDITADDFRTHMSDVIYHLDSPVAGPGSFPQYMVSKLAAEHVKVVLGGQGGDEIFGGYARYMVGYLERALLAEIDPAAAPNLPVSLSDIQPNLGMLKEYIPMMRQSYGHDLFGPFSQKYFNLCDRSHDFSGEVQSDLLGRPVVFEAFQSIFDDKKAIGEHDYFNKMTRFDLKALLPALLQVEDRMSMAHGLESRVPLLDHEIAEFAATIPPKIKFYQGRMKHMIRSSFEKDIPHAILHRRDKMGFPVPLKEWFGNDLNSYIRDILNESKNKNRAYLTNFDVDNMIEHSGRYSRKIWALMSLELWHQAFHDRQNEWKGLLSTQRRLAS